MAKSGTIDMNKPLPPSKPGGGPVTTRPMNANPSPPAGSQSLAPAEASAPEAGRGNPQLSIPGKLDAPLKPESPPIDPTQGRGPSAPLPLVPVVERPPGKLPAPGD